MDLTDHAKKLMSAASRSTIGAAMGELPITCATCPEWLPAGHRYEAPDISRKLRRDTTAGIIDGPALAQRIAASVPSHVLDGWDLFGRAIHCLMKGDTRASVHLGYYAELRAVLAIIASEGIGIFDKQHFVLASDGTAHRLCSEEGMPIEAGTHSVIWPVYDWWIRQPTALDLLKRVIRPGGKTIQEWFNVPERDDIYLAPGAQEWLIEWGLDLKRMNKDRGARNASSYGPSALHGWQTIERSESVKMVTDLWRVFDPTGNSIFEQIDRMFLQIIFQRAFKAQTTRKPGSNNWNIEIGRFVDRFLDDQAHNDLVQINRNDWRQYLIGAEGNGTRSLLEYASTSSVPSAVYFPVELLSRAALLLRLASGSCGDLFTQANLDWESLRFWLDDIGVRRGFWVPNRYPENATDLWTDIVEIMDDIEADLVDLKFDGGNLEECERIGMWGFGL